MRAEYGGFTVGDLARWCGARTIPQPATARRRVRLVQHDSRLVGPRDVFVALKTDVNDGHAYVAQAFEAGAVSAVVSTRGAAALPPGLQGKVIVTTNPLKGVQRAARTWRTNLGTLVVGITGSNGKTTMRSFVSTVLGSALPVCATEGNYNNHIGVPLSLLRMKEEHYVGVFEMGANHRGEIHTLSSLVKPDIAIITSIGYSHVGTFGSLQATTAAKLEIIDGLNPKGILLVNGDDGRLVRAARACGVAPVLFGTSARCAVRALDVRVSLRETSFRHEGQRYRLTAGGSHYVYPALVALHLAQRLGIERTCMVEAVAGLEAAALRGGIRTVGSVTFLLDCYNANPSSMRCALEQLCCAAGRSRRVAVVGDMLELGRFSTRLHRELGRKLAAVGVRLVVAVGEQACHVADGALQAGLCARSIEVVTHAREAATVLAKRIRSSDVVLLKGSRALALESVYEHFCAGGRA